MSLSAASSTLARASRSLQNPADPTESDGAVLTRFVATRDEDAFETLVRRLGPMVLAVCRRSIGDGHLAEDAFQAVFLVLARRAGDVRPREGVRGWLYGVAVRTAMEARAMSARRRRREVNVAAIPDRQGPSGEEPDAEVIALIDEEIAALPDRLRTAVVLCEMEGRARKEAAGLLRVAEGTLSSRLAEARKRLARRLKQRGVALSAAMLAAALTRPASAHLPPTLAARAVEIVTRGRITPPVAAISQGVLRLMFLNKLKTAVPVALIAAGLMACATVVAQPTASPPAVLATPKTPLAFTVIHKQPPPRIEPKPLPKGPNKLLISRAGQLTLIDPDGKNEQKVSENQDQFSPSNSRLSPDGKKLAFLVQTEKSSEALGRDPHRKIYVRDVTEKEPGLDLETPCQMYAWSPDGSRIAVSDFVFGAPEQPPTMVSRLVDVTSKEKKLLKLPDNHMITDWTRDGKYLLTTSLGVADGKLSARLHLMNLDGTEYKQLTDGKEVAIFGRVSPDGKRVLYSVRHFPKEDAPPRRELRVLEIANGKTTPVADLPLNGDVQGYCWSPDGKRIAYTWREIHQGKPEDLVNKETESHLVICNLDGKNPKTIASEKAQGQWIITIGEVDWR